jgi:cyclohexanone monooxygenase
VKPDEFDVVVVGAGWGGMYALYRLRNMGLSVRVLEQGGSVGGTWYWNRYPGARCDVESVDYCFSFDDQLQHEWTWTERFATQPEILRYADHVATRFDLRRDIDFETRVEAARYDDETRRWHVLTDTGRTLMTRYCVMAMGNLSAVNVPDFAGIADYRGRFVHTARWPEEGVDVAGLQVGVIGTGSTGIQLTPELAKHAERVTVFQRTANYSMPARNRLLTEDEIAAVKASYRERRVKSRWSMTGLPAEPATVSALEVSEKERRRSFDEGWREGGAHAILGQYSDMLTSRAANVHGADYVRERIRETVLDPEVAELLCPDDHPLGAKRICVDTGYYEAFNRDNVRLVDVRSAPIRRFTERGLETADGQQHALDVVVFATGFDAMTGAMLALDLRGRGGVPLQKVWAHGPQTYLGLATAGFPNLFIVTGPGSPSIFTNMVLAVEQHADWIADCIAHLDANGLVATEPTVKAQEAWTRHVSEAAAASLRSAGNSWYRGINIPGKPRVFMPYVGGLGPYRAICDEVAADDYRGFLTPVGEAVGVVR